jgi:predicted dehydrogenase
MTAPALREREALLGVLEDWTAAIRTGSKPMTDGHAGLRVLRVLEAAETSLREGSAAVALPSLAVAA